MCKKLDMLTILEDVPMHAHTTLAVGGPARYVALVDDLPGVQQALQFAAQKKVGVWALGHGSNVVVADTGLDGLVIRQQPQAPSLHKEQSQVLLSAPAGMLWDDLVRLSVDENLIGLECLSGIPGLVGAVPVQNVGAYGQQIADTLVAVHFIAANSGQKSTFNRAACGFGYRHSVFKNLRQPLQIITQVDFLLQPMQASKPYAQQGMPIRAPEIAEAQSLQEVRELILATRKSKSMCYDREDPNHRSVGSFFMNPVVPVAQAQALSKRFLAPMPQYAAQPGCIKLSAAWLIEQAGFSRGHVQGSVGLSTKHSLAIINRGGATARDVVAFANAIRCQVHAMFAIELKPEPTFLGFETLPW